VVERVKSYGVRTYIPKRQQKGRRHWEGKAGQQQAVYANRRRVQGNYGKRLLKRRGEVLERSFAHCYDTGGMRRTHLRKHNNILKRQMIHVAGFNLSILFRRLLGAGTPREWNNLGRLLLSFLLGLFTCYELPSALQKRHARISCCIYRKAGNPARCVGQKR